MLGLSAFVVGTAEFVAVGVLDRVAAGLHVSIGTVSLLVTAYALGVCVGGPALTALTIRQPRRLVLVCALGVYAAANAVAALSGAFAVLLVARWVAGAVHGLFVGAASAAASSLVEPERKGRAVAVVFGGIAAANLLGVPLGTYAGHVLPLQAVFAGVAVLGCATLVLVLAVVPSVPGNGRSRLRSQTRHVLTSGTLCALGTAVVLFGGEFTVFTLLGTYLQRVTGVSGASTGLYLLLFGAAGTVGTLVGGRLADRSAGTMLVAAGLVLVADLGVLYSAGRHPVTAGAAVAVFGLAAFGLAPALQVRTIELAGPGGDLASSLGASAGNAGIAAGSAIAGWFGAAHGVAGLPLAGAFICAAGLPLTWLVGRARPAAPVG